MKSNCKWLSKSNHTEFRSLLDDLATELGLPTTVNKTKIIETLLNHSGEKGGRSKGKFNKLLNTKAPLDAFGNILRLIVKVDPSAANDWLMKESSWFAPNHGEIGHYLKDVHKNYKTYKTKARKQLHHSKTNFSFEKMQELLESILDKNIPEFPKEVKLQLPKLKKLGGTEAPKPTLPKLKKN